MDEKIDYKKLAKEVEAERVKQESYKDKLTEKQVAEQTRILREIAKWNQDAKKNADGFYKLYEKSENKRVVDEEKLEKEKLARDEVGKGNLRAFIFQETKGIRETLKSGFEVNALTFGKMGVKMWNAFGLFGKFDVSGVVRKMDEYTKFTKERTEKNREAKMIEQLYDLYITNDKSKAAIASWLKTRGLKEEKITDLVETVSQLYKERIFQLQQSGVAKGLGNRGQVIASVPKEYYRKSKRESSKDGDDAESRSSYSIDFGDDDDAGRTKKRGGGGGSPKQIAILRDTHVELVRQGSILDGLLDAQKESNAQQAEFFDEQQQEWNRQKNKEDRGGKKGPIDAFIDSFKEKFMGGIFNALGEKLMGAFTNKMADWGASLAGSLTKVLSGPVGLGGVAIAGAMGVAIYSSLAPVMEKYFNKKANEELTKEYKEGGLTAQEATLGQAYGLDPTKFKNPDELFKAINEQKKKGVKANKQLAREAGKLAGAGINEKVTQDETTYDTEYGLVVKETAEEKMARVKKTAEEKMRKAEEASAKSTAPAGGGGVNVGQPIQNNNTTVIKERGNKGHIPDRLGTGG